MQTHAKAHEKKDKINEALELLNDAAKEKKDEVFEVINTKYGHVREMFSGAAENGQALAAQARKQLSNRLQVESRKIKLAAGAFDKKVHKNPWTYLGGAALGSLCVGLLLARKK